MSSVSASLTASFCAELGFEPLGKASGVIKSKWAVARHK